MAAVPVLVIDFGERPIPTGDGRDRSKECGRFPRRNSLPTSGNGQVRLETPATFPPLPVKSRVIFLGRFAVTTQDGKVVGGAGNLPEELRG
jgi:hypothetical protein